MNRRTLRLLLQVLSLIVGAELGIIGSQIALERINNDRWIWEPPKVDTMPLPENPADKPQIRPVAPKTTPYRPITKPGTTEPRYTRR